MVQRPLLRPLLQFSKSRNSKRKSLWAVPGVPPQGGYVAELSISSPEFVRPKAKNLSKAEAAKIPPPFFLGDERILNQIRQGQVRVPPKG